MDISTMHAAFVRWAASKDGGNYKDGNYLPRSDFGWAAWQEATRQAEVVGDGICDSCRRQINGPNCAYGVVPVDGECEKHSDEKHWPKGD